MKKLFKSPERQQLKRDAEVDYGDMKTRIDSGDVTARPLDTLRTDITESLGDRSGIFRGRYRHQAMVLLGEHYRADEKKDETGWLENRRIHSRNKKELEIDRLQEKIQDSPNTFLARQLNRHRRNKIEDLQYVKDKRLAPKIAAHEKKRLQKPEEIQKKIDALIRKKVASKRRKAEREYLNEQHHIDWSDRKKRIDILAHLSTDEKRVIMRKAIMELRRENIAKGVLDMGYEVDETATTRTLGHYSRNELE